jgi:hypothetical protein
MDARGSHDRPIAPARRDALALAAIVLIALCLLMPRLDDRFLWEDEAETALLAQRVLAFGVPVAWDGRDLISQECGTDVDARGLWRQSPWLPIYVVAASFHLLGADAFTARLPFVLLAAATLPSLWLLARRMFEDRLVALGAPLLLALSVPFLVYARQSRYYALVAFATVWVLAFLVSVLRGDRSGIPGLIVALSVLFHANYLVFAATVIALGAALPAARPDRAALGRLGRAALGVALLNAPWLVVFDAAGKATLTWQLASAGDVHVRVATYLGVVERSLFPTLVLVPALGVAIALRRRHRQPSLPRGLDAAALLAVFAIVHVLVLSVAPVLFVRYLVGLLPVFALLTAFVIATLAQSQRALAALVLIVVIAVDRDDLLRGRPGSPLAKYVGEITHEFVGPIEALTAHLAREARPDDRVFITYGALTLRFHATVATPNPIVREVRGGTGCQALAGWLPPEWLVVRSFFRLNPVAPAGREDAERVRDWVNGLILSGAYRRTELPAIDIVHDALPEPGIHLYRTPRDGPRVAVWQRVGL